MAYCGQVASMVGKKRHLREARPRSGDRAQIHYSTPVPFKVFVQRVVAVDGDNTEDWVMFRYNGPGKSETQTAPWAQRFKAGEGFYQTILPYLRKATIGDSR
jgi:hypothetical protein